MQKTVCMEAFKDDTFVERNVQKWFKSDLPDESFRQIHPDQEGSRFLKGKKVVCRYWRVHLSFTHSNAWNAKLIMCQKGRVSAKLSHFHAPRLLNGF